MTRETKIGLLVGLAFIIVIGILLSDHLTTSTEPPPAKLAQAGPSVRGGITIPGANNTQPQVVVPPTHVTPGNPVPTADDLAAAQARAQQEAARAIALQQQQSSPPQVVLEPPQQPTNASLRQTELAAAARRQGEPLIPVQPQQATQLVPASTVSPRTYTAVSGDTLSSLAQKLLGSNTKTHRQALMAANPSLMENPDLVVAGRTYAIPDGQTVSALSQAVRQSSAPKANASQQWYTVRSGDSLWRIAVEQTGSAGNVALIRDLNRQTLEGRDLVKVGMKLLLPGKNEVASVN